MAPRLCDSKRAGLIPVMVRWALKSGENPKHQKNQIPKGHRLFLLSLFQKYRPSCVSASTPPSSPFLPIPFPPCTKTFW